MRRNVTTLVTPLCCFAFFALTGANVAHAQDADSPLAPLAPPEPSAPESAPTPSAPPAPRAPPVVQAPAPMVPDEPSEARLEVPEEKPVTRARFGERGQFVVSAFSSLGISSTKYAESDASYFAIGVSPGVDYFFEKNVSIGLDLDAEYAQQRGYGADSSLVQTTSTTFAAGVRLGVNIPLGDWFSLYPRATLYATTSTSKQEVVDGSSISVATLGTPSDGTEHAARFFLYAPLLAHVAPGFFVGFGPNFGHDLARKNTGLAYQNLNTSFGAGAIVGGFF